MRNFWDILKGKTKEEVTGDKILNAMQNNNITKAKKIIDNSEGFIILHNENIFISALEKHKDNELALKILNKKPELITKDALSIAVQNSLAYELIDKIMDLNKKYFAEEHLDIAGKALYECSIDNEYLYVLVKKGADINYKKNNEPFIVWLAKEFVRRDISHKFNQINMDKKELDHSFIKMLIRSAFNLNADKRSVTSEGKGIFEIIAEGYNQDISDSLVMIHDKKYKSMINFLAEEGVEIKYPFVFENTEREYYIRGLAAKNEKNELEKILGEPIKVENKPKKRL